MSLAQRDPADQHLGSQPMLDHVRGHFHRVERYREVDGNLLGDRLVEPLAYEREP